MASRGDCGLVRGRWTPSPLEDGPGRDDRGPCRDPESRLAPACVVAWNRGRIRYWGRPVPLGRPRQVDRRGRGRRCGAVADSTACLNLNKVRLSRSPIRPQIPRVSRGTGPFPGAADSADRPARGRHQGPLPPAYWPKILHLSFSYSSVPGATKGASTSRMNACFVSPARGICNSALAAWCTAWAAGFRSSVGCWTAPREETADEGQLTLRALLVYFNRRLGNQNPARQGHCGRLAPSANLSETNAPVAALAPPIWKRTNAVQALPGGSYR